MAHLSIHNFGPIQSIELDIPPFLVLIGPQASGKSSISKLVYFFTSLHEELISFTFENSGTIDVRNLTAVKTAFAGQVGRKFRNWFGDSQNYADDFEIKFTYDVDKAITITPGTLPHRRFQSMFSDSLFRDDLHAIFQNVNKLDSIKGDSIFEKSAAKKLEKTIINSIFSIFGQNYNLRYIPAGRSLLSAVKSVMQNRFAAAAGFPMSSGMDDNSGTMTAREPVVRYGNAKEQAFFDPLVVDFIDRREFLKGAFSGAFIDEFIENTFLKIIVEKYQNEILRARYKVENDGTERLYFENGRRIRTEFASSGQQESLGILLDLLALVQPNTYDVVLPSLVVLEEPEAHLYPIGQKGMVEAIVAGFHSVPNNRFIITTHSPYTLTVLNNLIAAWKGAHLKETDELNPATADEIAKVIPQPTWLNPAQVGAYSVADGGITSIMTETGLIGENELDSASEVIMEDFYRMLEIRREKERGAHP